MPSPSGRPLTSRQAAGAAAEAAALQFLEQRGFRLVVTNFRSRYGEIDLIVRQDELLVFAEVRLRNHRHFGGAAASVTAPKQRKIIASAQTFLHHRPEFARCNCRFDVLAMRRDEQVWNVDWLPAAFTT